MHNCLRDFQNEYQNQRWGPVRVIHNWNLLLVEQGLAICLWHAEASTELSRTSSPSHGYKLAADYCRHFDSRYGNSLNGPSRTKILEMVRFMFTLEALEDGPE